jgi:hypothetical protein
MFATIEYKGIKLVIEGNYYEGSPEVMYYSDMSGHPGDPPEFEIEKVLCNDIDITELFEVIDDWETLEELALENID